jgi:hypothetical protein
MLTTFDLEGRTLLSTLCFAARDGLGRVCVMLEVEEYCHDIHDLALAPITFTRGLRLAHDLHLEEVYVHLSLLRRA